MTGVVLEDMVTALAGGGGLPESLYGGYSPRAHLRKRGNQATKAPP